MRAGQRSCAVVRSGVWAALEDGYLPCSSGEHQVLRVAVSIAEGVPIDLRDAVTCLDAVNSVLVARTVLTAGGHHQAAGALAGGLVMTTVTITRRRDPLEGERVSVLRRWRRKHGGIDLLVVLPNGRKRLIPQAWTDDAVPATDTEDDAAVARLGAAQDLSAAVLLVSALGERARGEQAASKSTSEKDNDGDHPQGVRKHAITATTEAGAPDKCAAPHLIQAPSRGPPGAKQAACDIARGFS